jgi:hypothetical protein
MPSDAEIKGIKIRPSPVSSGQRLALAKPISLEERFSRGRSPAVPLYSLCNHEAPRRLSSSAQTLCRRAKLTVASLSI